MPVESSPHHERPTWSLPWAIVLLVIAGALAFRMPGTTPPGTAMSWMDSLFTAASAVCGVGLSVRDPGTQLAPVGQVLLIVLVQLGAVLYAFYGAQFLLRLMTGRRPRSASVWRGVLTVLVLAEALGILALWPMHGLGWSAFHSISAFCNTAFALDHLSLAGQRYALTTHLVIAPLIVLGGLGYPVLVDLWRTFFAAMRHAPAAVHPLTRRILTLVCLFYLVGVLICLLPALMPYVYRGLGMDVEMYRALPRLTWRHLGEMLADSSFLSISARSCGLTTTTIDQLHPAARVALLPFMLLGAAPGGTASGLGMIVLLLPTVPRLAAGKNTNAGLPRQNAPHSAAALFVGFLALLWLAVFVLSLSEPYQMDKLLFAAVSAGSGAGFTAGICADMTSVGKCTLVVLMIAGRAGPLTLLSQWSAAPQNTA